MNGIRIFDIIFSSLVLVCGSPFILLFILLVWLSDFHNPFYCPPRIGLNGKRFKMVKLRSMVVDADKTQVDSTSLHDPRITKVGHLIRKFKLDELTQFINVFLGTMTIVGPRPNIERETILYTNEEQRLLSVSPGITDLSSIVFSDLAQIIAHSEDANIAYKQLVRPWKSRLGLFYVDHKNFWLNLQLIYLTCIVIISRKMALKGIVKLLKRYNADEKLIIVASREEPLIPYPPPGMDAIVTSRDD